jgi:diphthamide synthase subunit DPH2
LSSARRWVDGGGCVVVVHNGSEVVVAEEAARREDEDDNGRKNRGKADFSSTLACNFLMLRTRNPVLYIGGGRGTFFLY